MQRYSGNETSLLVQLSEKATNVHVGKFEYIKESDLVLVDVIGPGYKVYKKRKDIKFSA